MVAESGAILMFKDELDQNRYETAKKRKWCKFQARLMRQVKLPELEHHLRG
jgi:hypothetical protein